MVNRDDLKEKFSKGKKPSGQDFSELIDVSYTGIDGQQEITEDISDIQAYVGYTDEDIVGIEADLENKKVTRIAGAVNRTQGQPFDDIQAFGGRRRCTVANDGTVLGYYGESGYDETGDTGQVMVEQPKFYYKVVPLKLDKIEDGKGFHMRKARYYVSDYPKEGFKVHPAFLDENDLTRETIYLSAFEGSIFNVSDNVYLKDDEKTGNISEDMGASIAGVKTASGANNNLNRSNSRKLAENRGDGWQQSYSATVALTQMLFVIEYASFNMQEELSYGVLGQPSGSGNASGQTGATTSLGNESGFVERDGIEFPSYRGEENFYGNMWTWVDGLNIEAKGINDLYVATNSFQDNIGTGPYENSGFTLAKTDGYISAFGYGKEDLDWLFLASETSGNSSVPVGDYQYQNNTHNGWLVTRLGGYWHDGLSGGGFFWDLNYASGTSSRSIGFRLVYAPPAHKNN